VKCVYCEEEITIDEEAWTLHEPQPKCDLCRKDPKRMLEHIRRRGCLMYTRATSLQTCT
jgi:hypothetical protein